MNEFLFEAAEEIKRADHLVYVSLKYTRTVDVIKNIIDKFVSIYDLSINALLHFLYEKKKISTIPDTPLARISYVEELYKDDQKIKENMEFYRMLRKIAKAPYEKGEEYRRHVTMKAKVDEKIININIDVIHEYYDKVTDFFSHLKQIVEQADS